MDSGSSGSYAGFSVEPHKGAESKEPVPGDQMRFIAGQSVGRGRQNSCEVKDKDEGQDRQPTEINMQK